MLSQWHSLCSLSSMAEAAILSARCQFSLATAEVSSSPNDTFFALTEQEHPGAWRWAVYSTEDTALEEGSEPTRIAARRTAEATLLFLDRPCPLSA